MDCEDSVRVQFAQVDLDRFNRGGSAPVCTLERIEYKYVELLGASIASSRSIESRASPGTTSILARKSRQICEVSILHPSRSW